MRFEKFAANFNRKFVVEAVSVQDRERKFLWESTQQEHSAKSRKSLNPLQIDLTRFQVKSFEFPYNDVGPCWCSLGRI